MKNRTSELIYNQMLMTTPKDVSRASLAIMDSIQSDKVCNQILGLGAALICMLHRYNLSHVDVLGIADNMVYSGENNNMRPDFKAITNYMKDNWGLM